MKTQREAVAWIGAQVGKRLDYDGAYGAQCVDLIRMYVMFLGTAQPPGVTGAVNLWDVAWPSGYAKIGPANKPQPGDIAIFSTELFAKYGHTSLVYRVETDGFTSLDQNWVNSNLTTGSPGAFVKHPFAKLKGYVRPKFIEEAPVGMSRDRVAEIWKYYLRKPYTTADIDKWAGRPEAELVKAVAVTLRSRDIANEKLVAELRAKIKTLEAGVQSLPPGIYKVN